MPRYRRLACAAALPVALAACAARPVAPPPVPLTGTWLVDGVYDSGTNLPTPEERQALRQQAMRVTADQITDPLGRHCPNPVYEVHGTTAADWFGFSGAWLAQRGPDVPLTAVTVLCDGRAFDGYALRADGSLVSRYKDAYLVMRREDDPRVAERLPAVEQARFNQIAPPPAATPAPAHGTGAPATAAPLLIAAPQSHGQPAAHAATAAPPPPEALRPAHGAAAPAAASSGRPALHLASLRSEPAAAEEWLAIQEHLPQVRDWSVRFEPVTLPQKGRFVRILAVPPDGISLKDACATLERAGQYCQVMR